MIRARSLLLLALLGVLAARLPESVRSDPSNPLRKEISRQRAIEIARPQVKFQVKSVAAKRDTDNGRPVWRVTFRGKHVSEGHPMTEIMIVLVDRKTGEIVSLAQS